MDAIYRALLSHLGPQHWWPGDSPFEVAVGAILTQNTSWKNVAAAIENLRRRNLLDPHTLDKLPLPELAELIRPAGDRKSTRLNSSHIQKSRMPSSA